MAPEGPVKKWTSWVALESWSLKVIVVPAVTVRLAGVKLSSCGPPAPWGMVTVAPLDEVELLDVVELLDEEVLLVEVEDDEEELSVDEELVGDAELLEVMEELVVDDDEGFGIAK